MLAGLLTEDHIPEFGKFFFQMFELKNDGHI